MIRSSQNRLGFSCWTDIMPDGTQIILERDWKTSCEWIGFNSPVCAQYPTQPDPCADRGAVPGSKSTDNGKTWTIPNAPAAAAAAAPGKSPALLYAALGVGILLLMSSGK